MAAIRKEADAVLQVALSRFMAGRTFDARCVVWIAFVYR